MNTQNHTQKVFTFRHWTRKSYAVFQSLKLQIRIATLSIGLILSPNFQDLVAQKVIHQEAMEEYDLDTLEVLGELTPALANSVSRIIQVISISKQNESPLSSLQSALNSSPKLDLRQRGANDIQADISIRASTFDQVQILLNGFDMSDPQSGHHSLNLPIAFSQLQQVQILSGSGTRSMGVNSYAGSVNFVTKTEQNNEIKLGLNTGDFGYLGIDATISLHKNRVSNYLFVNKSSSAGYVKNTDYKIYSLFYNGKINLTKSNLEWQAAYKDKAFGANNFYTPKYPNQFEQLRTAFIGIRYKTNGLISTSSSVHYRANVDRFELFRDGVDAPGWYLNHNYHFSNVAQVNMRAWMWTKYGKSTFATNYRLESIFSNVLGKLMPLQKNALFDEDGFYNKSDSRSYLSFSYEHVYLWNNIKVAAGLIYYKLLDVNLPKKIYPGIDITYDVNRSLKLYGGINIGMRLPTFTDLYYSGPANIGNPDLLPESQTTYQFGYTYHFQHLVFTGNVFTNRANNSIDWVRKSDTLKWQPINISAVTTNGFDISLSYVNTKKSLCFLKWFNKATISWAYNNKYSTTENYQSHYVMDYLKNKVVITLEQNLYGGFSLGYIVRYQERVGQYMLYDAITGLNKAVDYNSFTLFDAKVSWDYKKWNFYVMATNIFNIQYNDYGNIVQPKRWFKVALSKRFSL